MKPTILATGTLAAAGIAFALIAISVLSSAPSAPAETKSALTQEQSDDCALRKVNLANQRKYIEDTDRKLTEWAKTDPDEKALYSNLSQLNDAMDVKYITYLNAVIDHAESVSGEVRRLRGWCIQATEAEGIGSDMNVVIGIDRRTRDRLVENLAKVRRLEFSQSR